MEDEALKVARELRSSWFLSRDTERPAGCRDPALRRCHRDSECADGFEGAKLVCLLNFADPEEQLRGICAREGSCYQHQHCCCLHPQRCDATAIGAWAGAQTCGAA